MFFFLLFYIPLFVLYVLQLYQYVALLCYPLLLFYFLFLYAAYHIAVGVGSSQRHVLPHSRLLSTVCPPQPQHLSLGGRQQEAQGVC